MTNFQTWCRRRGRKGEGEGSNKLVGLRWRRRRWFLCLFAFPLFRPAWQPLSWEEGGRATKRRKVSFLSPSHTEGNPFFLSPPLFFPLVLVVVGGKAARHWFANNPRGRGQKTHTSRFPRKKKVERRKQRHFSAFLRPSPITMVGIFLRAR